MTHCNTSECTPGDFEFEYQKITLPVVAEDFPDWSMIITIYIGFSLMFIAFLYFEWRTVYKCLKRCQEKGSTKGSQIGIVEIGDQDSM